MSTYDLYNNLKNDLGIDKIVDYLFVNKNTVLRWEKNKDVPKEYHFDFLSLQGDEKKIQKFISESSQKQKNQYFTKKSIAKYVFDKGIDFLRNYNVNISNYTFIEPSAGNGTFFNLLPRKKIGIDIEPKNKEFIKKNYLEFKPKTKNNIVIGNPPFGLRGNLALRFINHSIFADYIVMILPPLFDSDGKGAPRKRVKHHKLVYTENLPINSYEYPDGKNVNVSTVMQIWVKKDINISEIQLDYNCSKLIKVYSLSDGKSPSSQRNIKMIGKCDLYLPSTCFKGMKSYDNFSKLPNNRGYGIVIKKNKLNIKKYIKSIDWKKYAFKSTNSALNLRTSLIKKAILEGGFINE